MKFIADFHLHSKYSRATSKDMDLEHIVQWAKIKGIDLVGSGDFTHPFWFSELKKKLKPCAPGIFEYQGIKFILTTELSNIYTKNGKVRKVHSLIFAPSFEAVEYINRTLGRTANLTSDGRPILGFETKRLVELVMNASPSCALIPCHAWTPWFSVFGSNSGFDTLEECFDEYSKYIFAIETGLSSDPAMNWRISKLDNIALISCSDAHSPSKLGREACVFDCEVSYPEILQAVKNRDRSKFLFTIEFFPEEGKYHFDGHRNCNLVWSPLETKEHNGICPVCRRRVTVGVMNRVNALADRTAGFMPSSAIPYKNLVPLEEIVAQAIGVQPGAKSAASEYQKIIHLGGSELKILLDIPFEDLKNITSARIAEGIRLVREGKVKAQPGFDGQYGKIKVFDLEEEKNTVQIGLF
jgi:uncharacterized protein (TIGR00375 family)